MHSSQMLMNTSPVSVLFRARFTRMIHKYSSKNLPEELPGAAHVRKCRIFLPLLLEPLVAGSEKNRCVKSWEIYSPPPHTGAIKAQFVPFPEQPLPAAGPFIAAGKLP